MPGVTINTNMKRMLTAGPQEGLLLTELERQEIPVLSLSRHRALLDTFDDERLRGLLTRLAAKGWLQRIEAGKYVVVPRAARSSWHEHPFIVAAAIAPDPYYISYWSALSFHNLTEQMPRGVFVAITGRRKQALTFQGWRYRFVTRSPDAFFGFAMHELIGLNGAARVEVAIAEPEKAIFDSLDDERLAGGLSEVIKAVRRGFEDGTLSITRLVDVARRYPNAAVVARLGYILSHLSIADADDLSSFVRRTGYPPYLSASASRGKAHRDQAWNVLVNVPAEAFAESQ